MTPERLRVVEVRTAFRHPFATATTSLTHRRTVLVGLGAGETFGWGEAAPFPGVTRETVDDVWDALVAHGTTAGADGHDALPPTATAALDQARWDLAARMAGETLASRLGASGRGVPLTVAVGIAPDLATLVAWVGEAVAAGARGVKLKIRPGWDVEAIAAVRRRFPDLVVSADANGSYGSTDDPVFDRLDTLGLAHLEQPLPAEDVRGSARLVARLATPICLDESVTSMAAVEAIAQEAAADLVCLKPGRLGLTGLVVIHDAVAATGTRVKISGMLESGVGRAHTLAVCGLSGVAAADLAPPGWYFPETVAPVPEVVDGHALVPPRPGIGVDPLPGPVTRERTFRM